MISPTGVKPTGNTLSAALAGQTLGVVAAAVRVAVVLCDGRQRAVAAATRGSAGLNPSPRSGVVQIPVALAVLRGDGRSSARVASPLR